MALEYDVAYHLHCRLVLDSGRKVVLDHLNQARTYGGLLEGCPTAETNDHVVAGAIDDARGEQRSGTGIYLVEPKRRPYLRRPGDCDDSSPFGAPEWLPMIQCTASFGSVFGTKGGNGDGSRLTVVWFQDEYALPIDPDVLAEIRGIDWDAVALDIEY